MKSGVHPMKKSCDDKKKEECLADLLKKKTKNVRTLAEGEEYTARIVAAFGDISGFGQWFDSISDQEQELKPFMRTLDAAIDAFEDESQYFVKRTGDGFLVIMELKKDDNGHEMTTFLLRLIEMETKINKLIQIQRYPRPEGYRIRVTSGFAWKKVHRGHVDYIAKSINLASKLLRVGKHVPFIIHESVKDVVPKSAVTKHLFKFDKTITGSEFPDGVYRKDVDSLWSVRIKSGKPRAALHRVTNAQKERHRG